MATESVNEKSVEELQAEVSQLRQHLYDLKSQAVTEKLEDPSQLRKARRQIARCLTALSMKQAKNTETSQS